jgi:hypothetical protein
LLVTFEKIDELSYGALDYYTVRLGNNELTEFENFDSKDFSTHNNEVRLIYNTISLMQETGAKEHYFKFEDSAGALPKVPYALMDANKDDFGIRLYCKMVSEKIVVLFNGDIKTIQGGAVKCPRVGPHFRRATKISLHIDKAIASRDINLSDPNPFENFELDI